MGAEESIAVVIPCYRVRRHILEVVRGLGPEVTTVFVVDDKCPEGSGDLVREQCRDPRVRVIFNERNLGVGGATMAGYRAALEAGCDFIVKLDGDGQMDAARIPQLVRPIREGLADYTKGNRFFNLEDLKAMPAARLAGNALLSFVNKAVSGYWHVMDPTNGYTAIHARVLALLPLDKIDRGYFFESDMLFRLGTLRAMVRDVPMPPRYGDETSSMRISRVLLAFPGKYCVRFLKRIVYSYFVRDFNAGTIELLAGIPLFIFGVVFGLATWKESVDAGVAATSGTVMLAALPTLIGFQLLLNAISFDIHNAPSEPIHRLLD